MNDILQTMDWSQPTVIDGKVLVTAIPNGFFWDLWRMNKDSLKASGVFVSKKKGNWVVQRYIQASTEYTRTKLSKKPIKSLKDSSTLRNYQKPHVLQLINVFQTYNIAVDMSDPGTGKTICALEVAKQKKLKPFIVCPKPAISVWEYWANYIGIKSNDIKIFNYERLKTWKTVYVTNVKKGKSANSIIWELPKDTLIIFDEIHRAKGLNSDNSKLLISAKISGHPLLCLSATLAENPLDMKAVGFALELFPRLEDFWSWVKNYGCGLDDIYTKNKVGKVVTRKIMAFSGSNYHLQNLHKVILPDKGSRMCIEDLGDEFPDNQIVAEAYTMDSSTQIQKIYEEMSESLIKLTRQSSLDNEDNHLTIMLRARQRIELLKVPTFVEMAKDYINQGCSVIIFVNFKETLNQLKKKLKTNCVVTGSQTGKKGELERTNNIKYFQADKARLILCNIQAGGESISLHDLHGNHRRVTLISPTWSARKLMQVLGRAPRSGAKTKVLQRLIYASQTIEEDIAKAVSGKIERINMLNDGDLQKGINLNIK